MSSSSSGNSVEAISSANLGGNSLNSSPAELLLARSLSSEVNKEGSAVSKVDGSGSFSVSSTKA